VNACRGELAEPVPPQRSSKTSLKTDDEPLIHGKTILYAKHDATVSDDFHAWAMSHSSLDATTCQLADIPAAGEGIVPGQPILTAFAAAPAAKYDGEMKRLLAQVESRLYPEE